MTREELNRLLQRFEWTDFEAKAAQTAAPKDAYETVSAFANTQGGHLVFGVEETDGHFAIVGVLQVDKVQNEFLSALRSKEKISCLLDTKQDIVDSDGHKVLVFYIPEARRSDKPVFLNGDIRRSFIRRGGGDQRCSEDDIKRFLRAAASDPYDGSLCEGLELRRCIDEATLQWYGQQYANRNPDASVNALDTVGFLEHWGLVAMAGGVPRPTVAAILLFGSGAAVRSVLPRPLVDCRWHTHRSDDPQADERWQDRLVCEDNIIQTWREVQEHYVRRASFPFALDPKTMARAERPEDFVSFREATINLLIHQDYAEKTKQASISFFSDRTVFSNPGTAFASKAALLEPGEKDLRNPRIVSALRRLGLSEAAGTGLRAIYTDWRRRGRVPPEIESDVSRYEFRLTLRGEELLSEQQLLFQASLGVHLAQEEADALAMLCQAPVVSLPEFRASLAMPAARVEVALAHLVRQVLAERFATQDGAAYRLASHLREIWNRPAAEADLVTDQAGKAATDLVTDQAQGRQAVQVVEQQDHRSGRTPLASLTEAQRALLLACDTPRSQVELMSIAGVTHRTHFRTQHLQPLIDAGLLQLKYPENPRHPRQRYGLTPIGAKLLARGRRGGPA